jgi:anaerobic magnesium-protoporphyrin IX monomethyl ester cyclase
MKILFLNPPRLDGTVMVKEGRCMQREGAWGYVMAPVTMVTMATMARLDGHDATVMDCPADGTTFAAMVEGVARLAPDVAYVNTSTPSIADDLAAAAAVKQRCPKPPVVVLYGIHPTCRFDELLAPGTGVDGCVLGEPELTVRGLTDALAKGEAPQTVPGLAWRDAGGRPMVAAPRPPISDLDALPIPDWSFVDTGNYRLPLNDAKFLLVNTNRGCPYRCTFCNAYVYYGRVPRRRSAAHVLRELANDVQAFGVSDFMFWAEEFILDHAFVLELCEAITRSGLEIRWVCNSRVDAVTPEVLAAIKRAGCWNIAFGIESGDQSVLDSTNKGTTVHQVRSAVAMAREAGLQVTGHVVLGFPQDTAESIAETGRFVDSLELDFVQYYCAMPYPGTDLERDAREHGWLTSTDWKRWEHNQSVLDYPRLSAAETMRLRRRLMLRWYFTPRRILRTVRNHVRRPSDAWALLSRLFGFVRWM